MFDFLNLDTGTIPLLLVGAVIFLVLLFEFINGFHDTANAVATVIYTRSMKPIPAVVWSGVWNFLGAFLSTGAVAMGIIKLVPPGMLDHSSLGTEIAMVIAIPLAAIIWNFGTWYLGLPASSSHTMIGAIVGVVIAYSLMAGGHDPQAGVNWKKIGDVGLSLLISPMIGFLCAGGLLLLTKKCLKNQELYRAPDEGKRPPLWVRGLLIFTCTGVSFAHGSNDGQKGMGLMMIVLAVLLPHIYAIDLTQGAVGIPDWVKLSIALALGCGTMVAWKRIVVTVGEKIGKTHMSYAQGACAEMIAMGTIQAASTFGLPVSTTHVLSSGVAGTMFANGSGLQKRTVKHILLAWILTLPVTVLLGSALFAGLTYFLLKVLGMH